MSTPTASTAVPLSTYETTCLIVGAGPAGAMLALLLARQGIDVTLLESHQDFDRDFRGDTLHPMILEVLDEIGLAERTLQLEHARVRSITSPFGGVTFPLHAVRSKFPFMVVMPQVRFLEFITAEAAHYPNFKLVLGANAQQLVKRNGVVRGVRYQADDGLHEVRALLTVGADGRFSKLRHLMGGEPQKLAAPMDVLWLRVPRMPSDPDFGVTLRTGSGHFLVILARPDAWQLGYVIPKGGFAALRTEGLATLRQSIVGLAPEFADRIDTLADWKQVAVLTVESSRLQRWYKPGLLLIGDAAHVISPVGGVGINYAVQDAVVAANVLTRPLRAGHVHERHLAAVQRRRMWPVRLVQAAQGLVQRKVLAPTLAAGQLVRVPRLLRWGFVRRLLGRYMALGLRRVHVKHRQATVQSLLTPIQ